MWYVSEQKVSQWLNWKYKLLYRSLLMYFFPLYFFFFLRKELIILSLFIRKKMLVDILHFCWDYVSFLKISCLHTCLISNTKYKLHLHTYKIRYKLHLHIYKGKVKTATCCICSNEICRGKKCLTILKA